jgi:hypothetical protein
VAEQAAMTLATIALIVAIGFIMGSALVNALC